MERYNNFTGKQFKQYSEKMTGLDKTINDRLKAVENNVNVSIKNMKEGMNRTISSFEMQIKDVLADNRLNSEKVRKIIID